jgi:2-polyprenyl-3-methyl-5-hydroxy-6-metoxy-1,4-benzoquinol methylase
MSKIKECNCKICNNKSEFIFEAKILNKYDVCYYQCSICEFIQTEEPYWISEAYESTITGFDIGYVSRNIQLAEIVNRMLSFFDFNSKASYIDYGGGYGLFVRKMRDNGFDFYRQDIYCDNIFSKEFDINDIDIKSNFELLTTFEVFEHLVNPIDEIEKMLKYSTSILFSTELQPKIKFNSTKDWRYFVPEFGQHISLYSYKTLEYLAEKYNLNLYSNNKNLHLLTPKKFIINPINFSYWIQTFIDVLFSRHFNNKKSLINTDLIKLNKKFFG